MYMMDFSKPPHASETETHSQRHQEREQQLISGGGKGIWWEISNWLILGGILVVLFLLFKYVF
ncbi:Uncharacterized protein PIL02S_03906 [Paenibacillus illinoisensis]|jgi:hypothetical protein|uniref:Uncharacterized protein n=3 Tax=Paenibacillus TaxID=44249 RepID=A0A2W0CHP3_9BACL|nr:Uncharacterized protein PIL02S_03906 [Paenibacillus illinoisensis]